MHVSSASVARRLAGERPVVLMIFDVLWLDGHSTMELPYTDRRTLLDQLALAGPTWQTPPTTFGGGDAVLRAATELGLEGVVAKRLDSAYLPGRRSDAWRKVKPDARARSSWWADGFRARAGSRAGSARCSSATTTTTAALQYAGRVGSGLDETARAAPRAASSRRSRATPARSRTRRG